MADDTLKAVAENKIKELEGEAERLREDLRSKQSFHSAAWAEYGSELCAGGMLRDEQEIRLGIIRIERNINLLRSFVRGDLDLSEQDYLEQRRGEYDVEIADLNERKGRVNEQLETINSVKRLLSI